MKTPKAMLFDWDNTLVDSWPIIHAALNHTFKQFGMPEWDRKTVQQKSRKSLRDNFPPLFGTRWQEARTIYYNEYSRIHASMMQPLSGANSLLDYLHKQAFPVGIISNKRHENLQIEIKRLQWEKYFAFAYGSGAAGHDKPQPDMGQKALKQLQMTSPAGVYYVGDTLLDVEFAHQCQFQSIIIGNRQECGTPPIEAHHYFPNLDEFNHYLSSIF